MRRAQNITAISHVLDWRDPERWFSDIDRYAGGLLNSTLKRRLRISKPSGCWSDNLSWLPDPDIETDFRELFLGFYSRAKGFHGCRPVSVRSYYERGLLGQNRRIIEETFRQLFSDIDGSLLETAIEQMTHRGHDENGKIYFVSDDTYLVEECGHYLIQGSEYLIALAASLCDQRFSLEDFRLRLRTIGIPTIFEVDIPFSLVPEAQVAAACRSILAEWGKRALNSDRGGADGLVWIPRSDLSSEYIQAHWHPKKIPDPFFAHGVYIARSTQCDACDSRTYKSDGT